MPDLDLDDGADSQDGAETFDESHRDTLDAGGVDSDDEPDIADDVYDVTSAIGDADEDGLQYEMDAADFSADSLDDDGLEDDEDEDDALHDGLEDEPEASDFEDDDDPVASSPAARRPANRA